MAIKNNGLDIGLRLDFDTADAITLANLKNYLKGVKQMTKDHRKNGTYMHPEDLQFNEQTLIPALKVVVKHYGG